MYLHVTCIVLLNMYNSMHIFMLNTVHVGTVFNSIHFCWNTDRIITIVLLENIKFWKVCYQKLWWLKVRHNVAILLENGVKSEFYVVTAAILRTGVASQSHHDKRDHPSPPPPLLRTPHKPSLSLMSAPKTHVGCNILY